MSWIGHDVAVAHRARGAPPAVLAERCSGTVLAPGTDSRSHRSPLSGRHAPLPQNAVTRALPTILTIGLEVVAVLLLCGGLYVIARWCLSRIAASGTRSLAAWSETVRISVRRLLFLFATLLLTAIGGFNGWLISRGLDVHGYTVALLASVTPETRLAIGLALAKLAAGAVALLVGSRLLRRGLGAAERAINEGDGLTTNNRSLTRLFNGLHHSIVQTAWLLLAVWGCTWLGLPQAVIDVMVAAVRIFLIASIGWLVIRSTDFTVDTLDGMSRRAAHTRGWVERYDRLRPLLPLFRACLEYALWIGVVSLVLLQIGALRHVAAWGPVLIQAIAIFFGGRVVIDLGLHEISRRMLPREGLSEADRRRRMTILPLVRSTFVYAGYFGTAVLILSAMGFNPMPFLAGAGILGLVIGFGAQSLINDVVSGFFILLENMYLVGDTIEVSAARGVVESIDFRTTKIRDGDGRLHVIRNGAMTPVINYSKDYTMAVVPVEVTYDADLRTVFGTLQRAGERLRKDHPDVLADTEVVGITSFGASSMTVKTSTRVKPGCHDSVAASMRLLIKELFDRQAAGGPRKTLVPTPAGERHPWPATGQGA
jgi:small conductance mechanosensitive channel